MTIDNIDTATNALVPTTPAAGRFGMSRRTMLASLGLSSLGLLTAPQLVGHASAAPDDRPLDPHRRDHHHDHKHKHKHKHKKTSLGDSAGYTPPGPYTMQASCVLSEDYFYTDEVIMDTKAKVLPFLNTATGVTEAVVLTTDGNLSYLRPDPASASGWAYTTITTELTTVADVAVTSSASHNAMLMAIGALGSDKLRPACQLSLTSDGTWTSASTGEVPAISTIGAGATGTGGDIYFYGWTQSANTATKNYDYTFWRWNGTGNNPGVDTGTVACTLSYGIPSGTFVVAADLQIDAKIGGFPYTFLVATTWDVNGPKYGATLHSYRIVDGAVFDELATEGGVSQLLWSYVSPDSSVPAPAILWQTTDGNIHFVDETGAQANLYNAGATTDAQVAAWQLDNEYTFALINDSTDDNGSTVNIVSQFGSGGTSGFTLPIPLVSGIQRIYGRPTDPNEGTLFAVDLDDTLSVLTKTATGWTQNVVHQDGKTMQQVSSWRCKIELDDTNGAPVLGGQVRLSTDRPVGLWQASGSSTLMPGTPVVMTCDAGTLTLSIPAAELDAAQLTAQPLDANGNDYGSPLTIVADHDVQSFLKGNGSLTGIGTLTGAALSGAQNTAWDTTTKSYQQSGNVLPVLKDGGSTSDAVATAISHIASLPTNVPSASGTQAALLDFTSGTPTLQTSTNPKAFDSQKSGETSWWDKAEHDIESVFHGLRHGAISIKKLVTSWEQDAKQWTINLVVTIGDDVEHLINYIVQTVKDVIHAISGLIHALEADVEDFINWLKHFVLGVLKDAEINSKSLEGWSDDLVGHVTHEISTIKGLADSYLTDAEDTVEGWIEQLQAEVTGTTLGSVTTQPTPTTDSGGDASNLAFKAVGDFNKAMQYAPGKWLLDKIEAHMKTITSDQITVDLEPFKTPVLDIFDGLNAAEDTAEAAVKLVFDGMKAMADGFSGTDLSAVFADLLTLVPDGFKMVEDVVDFVLDLMAAILECLDELLKTPFELPFIGDLLDLVGIDTSTSILHITSLIACFPATIINNLIVGEGPMFPSDDSTVEAGQLGAVADKMGFSLNLLAGVIQSVWSFADIVIDASGLVDDKDMTNGGTIAVEFFSICDFILPVFMTALQWPVPTDAWLQKEVGNTNTPAPFQYTTGVWTDNSKWGQWSKLYPGIIASTVVPYLWQGVFWCLQSYESTVAGWSSDDWLQILGDYTTPFVQCWSGGVNAALGAFVAYENSDSTTDKVWAIVDWVIPNLSYIDQPLGISWEEDATEMGSGAAMLVIDAVTNIASAGFCFQQAAACR